MLTATPPSRRKNGRSKQRVSPPLPRNLRRKAGALIAACIVFAAGALFSRIQTGGEPGKSSPNAPRQQESGYRVTQVPDGDTLVLKTTTGKQQRVRLYGVDAPELHQRSGKAAASYAQGLLKSENVALRVMDTDQYDRAVALVILKDGRILNEELVKAGHAWVYRAHCHEESLCPSWHALERQAKKEGRGLWRDNDPMPPWQWRRQNPRK